MRKYLFFFLICLFGVSVIGQNVPKLKKEKLIFVKPDPVPQATVLWSSDFSNSAEWTFGNNSNPTADWVIGTAAPNGTASKFLGKIQSTTQNNGFALFDSDALGDNSSTHDAWVETTNPIDLSANGDIAVEFESYYRKYQDNVYLEVSNDGNNWDPYEVHTDLQSNETSDNPEKIWVDVSATAGNEATVWIRFRFIGSWDYAWMVDDVSIIEIPDNDLRLVQHYFNHSITLDSTKATYYTHIPKQQAQFDSLNFAALVQNRGVATQTNSRLTTKVYGAVNYADTSSEKNIASGNIDSLFIQNTPFIPYQKGDYEVDFSLTSDFTDDEQQDNATSFEFIVGDSTYARDNGTAGNGVWFGPNTKWRAGNLFEIHNTDTVTSVSFWFDGATTTGADVIAHIYNATFTNVVASSVVELSSAQIGTWVTIPVAPTELTAGNYIAAFEQVNSNEQVLIATGMNNPMASPLTSFTDEDANGSWEYVEFIPFIRMNLKEKTCPIISSIISTTNPTCGNTDGSATIIPSGGNAPYTYQWSSNTGGQTTQTATGLGAGIYTVFVFDANQCLTVDTLWMNDAGAATLSAANTHIICGGICTGAIDLNLTGGTSPFQFAWNNTETTEDLNNICGGIYAVTVTDNNNCKSVATYNLTEPKPLKVTLDESGDTGFGDGLASAEATGGTEPYEYLWHTGDTTASINGLSGGFYSITVTDSNGCKVVDSVYVTGISYIDKRSLEVRLFPNPAKEQVNIVVGNDHHTGFVLEVYSMEGRLIESKTYNTNKAILATNKYTSGLYLVKIISANRQFFQRLVVGN